MKIGIVCLNLSWQSGGPRLIFSLARALRAQGHTVIIYAPEFSGKYFKELWEGLDIRVVPPKESLRWMDLPKGIFARVLDKIAEERRRLDAARALTDAMDPDFDVVNVHDFAYPAGYFYKKRNPKAKILWTENDPPFSYMPKASLALDLLARIYQFIKERTEKRFFKAINVVSVLDTYNKAWCEKRGLNASIVRLGVDFDKFYLPVKDFSGKAKNRSIRLFALGSLTPGRRYEDIVEAVKLLRAEGYDATARIIANDQWNSTEYRSKLMALLAAGDTAKWVNISFTGVPHDELRKAFFETDVFPYPMYLPFPRNGFGFSIGVFEAMAAGLPVILCDTTTSTEVLKDGETALFVHPMDPRGIADQAKKLIASPKLYASIAHTAQDFVKSVLTWESYTDQALRLILNS
jgi:glycosyltransferase involved in cell wall biosynthesis